MASRDRLPTKITDQTVKVSEVSAPIQISKLDNGHVDFNSNGVIQVSKIFRDQLVKQFGNRNIVKYPNNPILSEGGYGAYGYEHPSVIKVDDTYYMFVASFPTTVSEKRSISYATSSDGENWQLHDNGNPILVKGAVGEWDDQEVCDPFVVYNLTPNQYWIYYVGRNTANILGFGLATSSSISGPWIKHPANPILTGGGVGAWDEAPISPTVIKGLTQYYMYYGGYALAPIQIRIGVATSPDGIVWTKYGSNPILSTAGSLLIGEKDYKYLGQKAVLYLNGWITMLYEGLGCGNFSIDIAWSKNFYNFARGDAPILTMGGFSCFQSGASDKSWDSRLIGQPFLFLDSDGTCKLYYFSETFGTPIRRIGMAYVNLEMLSPNQSQVRNSLEWRIWKDATIVPVGSNSFDIPCTNFRKKTIYLLSDQNGTLTIYVDPDKSGTYRAFLSGIIITANTMYSTMTEYGMAYMRLNFVPSAQATVNAYVVTEQ
jgi:hypothetical protein